MSKLSFRARALDASKPMPIYLAEELPDLPDYSAINRAVPQMPSGMEKEEESEHHLQRAISGTGLIIPTPEVCQVNDIEFYERCYPPDYKMPKQHIHMQPLWEEQEAPEYDMDSEDERWLKQQGHPELTELKFEQMMDKLEKSSGQTVVTLNEAKLLLERQDDLVIAVYDYWLNKRLTTQHPLILSVKTENRPGQSSNNPYLAFRRRTEKMQTRKNRKNDESSYEKMLKLRRDLARALNLLELVARREKAKRELVKLTALLAERRYVAGDFANQLLPDPPPRPAYTAVPLTSNFRREAYSVPHYPSRPPPTPVDQPRQREKRTYKRRKHRHAPVGAGAGAAHAFRDSGVYTSSEEESSRVETSSPPDDGPFAFRRKPGCYYEMPTSTLNGDPVDAEDTSKDRLYQHEIDPRHRYTLTSINEPYRHCIGFARRRVGRGGRILLDRIATPLDDLWPHLPFHQNDDTDKLNERELENKWHRTPKEITRDYHTSGKYPWRHAFRRHLSRHPELWVQDAEPKVEEPKPSLFDGPKPSGVYDGSKPSGVYDGSKPSGVYDGSSGLYDFKSSGVYNVPKYDGLKSSGLFDSSKSSGVYDRPNSSTVYDRPNSSTVYDRPNSSNIYDESKTCVLDSKSVYDFKTDVASLPDVIQDSVKSESGKSARSFEVRKRSWSDCSDSSYDSDESLYPVEKEFEKFIDEVNRKWLHFRPKTPPPSPPLPEPTDTYPIEPDTPIAVEIRGAPTDGLTTDTFTTTEFTLGQLYPDVGQDVDSSGTSLDISGDDLLGENFTGLTEDQMESILSETDLKSLDVDEKKMNLSDDILDVLVNDVDGKEPFLLQGQSKDGRTASGPRKKKVESFGSSCVIVSAGERERVQCSLPPAPPAPAPVVPAPVTRAPPTVRPSTSAPITLRAHSSPHPPALRIPPKLHPVEVTTPAPTPAPAPDPNPVPVTVAVPNSKIIVEEVNEVTLTRDNKKSHDTIEEIQLPHGVQLKTVQTKHSPLKKHIITSAAHTASVRARSEAASSTVTPTVHVSTTQHAPQIVTVAVSDSLKVRLQNHLLSNQSGVLVQNGPFQPVVAVPMQQNRETGVSTVSIAGTSGTTRRVSAPLVQLAPGTLHKSAVTSVASVASGTVVGNKLKVVHAHPLSAAARAQLLQARHLQHLPTVVSLAALDAAKQTALIKTPGSQVAQLFEIKGGAHLVNVVRPPAPTRLARLDPRLLRPAHLLRKDKQPLAANLQAIAFTAPGGLKARTARLVPPRAAAPNPPAQHHPAPDDRA